MNRGEARRIPAASDRRSDGAPAARIRGGLPARAQAAAAAAAHTRVALADLSLLQRSFAASILLHVGLLLVDPFEGPVLIAADRITLSIAREDEAPLPEREVLPSRAAAPSAALEVTPAAAPAETRPREQSPPSPRHSISPRERFAAAAAASALLRGSALAAQANSYAARAEIAATPLQAADEVSTAFDEKAADALLARVRKERAEAEPLRQYRVAVRERIREHLLAVWASTHAAGGSASAARGARIYVLRFRVDPNGAIFDLRIEAPPGSAPAPPKLREEISALSPLAAPPAPADRALEFEFVIE